MAETNENFAALDQKIVQLQAELDQLIAAEGESSEPDEDRSEAISDIEVQLRSLTRQRSALAEKS